MVVKDKDVFGWRDFNEDERKNNWESRAYFVVDLFFAYTFWFYFLSLFLLRIKHVKSFILSFFIFFIIIKHIIFLIFFSFVFYFPPNTQTF